MKRIFDRIPNEKIWQLTIRLLKFSAHIVIRRPFQILLDASNESLNTHIIPIDSQCNNGYLKGFLEMLSKE